MKSFFKITVVMFTISLLALVSVAYAQDMTAINTNSPTTSNLNAVAIVSNSSSPTLMNSEAWAVGDAGTIIMWNGTNWETVNSPTSSNLYGIVMVNSSAGLAVGGNNTNGVILKYDGNWSTMNVNPSVNSTLYGVTADSSGSPAWAVGTNGTILNWNGNQWSQQTSPTNNTLRSVAMVHGSNNAWAVGDNGTIIQYDGTSWSNVTSPTMSNLNSIVMVNTTSGWAVGGLANTGVIINMNGSTWSNWARINFGGAINTSSGYVVDKINATLNSLSIDNASSAWAAGANGTTLYWTGTEWAGQVGVLGGASINGIAVVHGAESENSYAWAVGGGGKVLAWTGTAWIPEFPVLMLPLILSAIAVAAYIGKTRFGKKQI